MNSDFFEQAVSDFLDSDGCEEVNDSFFRALRTAFAAGWNAAERHINENKLFVLANSYNQIKR